MMPAPLSSTASHRGHSPEMLERLQRWRLAPNVISAAELVEVRPGDVRSGIKKALEHSGPVLIDAVTDPNALSIPPHISAEQVKGFGVAMMKLALSGHIDEVVDTVEANIRQRP